MYPLREEKKLGNHKTVHTAHQGFPCCSTRRGNLNELQTLIYGEAKTVLKIL